MIKIKFENNNIVTEIKWESNDKFKYNCGKSFKLSYSFWNHTKKCNNKIIKEIIIKNINNSKSDKDNNQRDFEDISINYIDNKNQDNWLIINNK